MNGLATNSSIPQNGLAGGANRSDLLDTKISFLKILALSLLREIASVEKMEDGQGSDSIDLHAEVRRFERELIRSALIQTGGRQRPAARLLGTKVTTLNTKIKRYKIEIPTSSNPR
jgi:transcriptional regulator with GAF, ATPase, and Fis domain